MLKLNIISSRLFPYGLGRVSHSGFCRRPRRGYAVIEILVTASLLSAAMLGVAQLARVHSLIRRQAEDRLFAELIAGNVIERFRGVSLDQIGERRQAVEADSMPLPVSIEAFSIKSDSIRGSHLVIRVFEGNETSEANPLVTLHHWVLEPSQASDVEEGLP